MSVAIVARECVEKYGDLKRAESVVGTGPWMLENHRPALSRPNLTLLLNTKVVKLNFKGTRCVAVKLMKDDAVKDITADKEVILAAVPSITASF